MLVAFSLQKPIEVPANSEALLLVENNLNIDEVLFPKLIVSNFGTETLEVSIVRKIDLGSSDDPRYNGYVQDTVLDWTEVESGKSLEHTPSGSLTSGGYPTITHTVHVRGVDTEAENIVQVFVLGCTEDTVKSGLLSYRV